MRFRAAMLCAALAGIAACGEMRPTSPGRTTEAGTGGVTVPVPGTSLVGSWSFARIFSDGGSMHLSQTVWTFGSAGDVTRKVYSDNLTAGVGDVIITRGTWTASARVIEVRFEGTTAPVRYDYRFDGGALILAGTAFLRISQ